MTELTCPMCEEILEDFVLTQRGRCAHCGAEVEKIITLLQTRLAVTEEALENIVVVFEHGGTISEVARIALEVI